MCPKPKTERYFYCSLTLKTYQRRNSCVFCGRTLHNLIRRSLPAPPPRAIWGTSTIWAYCPATIIVLRHERTIPGSRPIPAHYLGDLPPTKRVVFPSVFSRVPGTLRTNDTHFRLSKWLMPGKHREGLVRSMGTTYLKEQHARFRDPRIRTRRLAIAIKGKGEGADGWFLCQGRITIFHTSWSGITIRLVVPIPLPSDMLLCYRQDMQSDQFPPRTFCGRRNRSANKKRKRRRNNHSALSPFCTIGCMQKEQSL
jgi:hypothetical protein